MGNQGLRQHIETSSKTGVFHLSKAKLQEFPPELVKIISVLRNIDLSENKISHMPENIGAFVNLKVLNLSHNHIETIPDKIGLLLKLETLSLASNRIRSIPPSMQSLQKLKDVNLSANLLTTFPLALCSCRYLSVLDLSNNQITEVPQGVGELQVVELILNNNKIRKLNEDLARCSNLKTLRIQNNIIKLQDFPTKILSDSQISLISFEGNPFDAKQLSQSEGYEMYMERFTSTKKKLT